MNLDQIHVTKTFQRRNLALSAKRQEKVKKTLERAIRYTDDMIRDTCPDKKTAAPIGFEPTTQGLGNLRSIP